MGHLLQNRIIFVGRVVNDVVRVPVCAQLRALTCSQVAQQICTALMALEMEDPTKDIKARVRTARCVWLRSRCWQMYINAGGGQQYSIMAVIDMMNTVKCDVSTVAVGNVASTAVRARV
jgi:ATP-dependent protease ClpP protease subunit